MVCGSSLQCIHKKQDDGEVKLKHSLMYFPMIFLTANTALKQLHDNPFSDQQPKMTKGLQ